MYGKLVPCGGGIPVPLLKTTVVVGRKPDCDVLVPCRSISGHHCELQLVDGMWWIRDLGSKNGTSVNGVHGEKLSVAPNHVITVGRQRFVCIYQSGGPPTAAAVAVAAADEALAFELLTGEKAPEAAPVSSPPEPPPPSAVQRSTAVPKPKARADLGKLVPCGGGAPIPLVFPELIIGRNHDCDVSIRLPAISSRHCRLKWNDGYWFVEDLNSTNGTWVNGARCLKQCLPPDSLLGLGKHRFTIHYTATGDAPPEEAGPRFKKSLLEEAGLSNQLLGDRLGGRRLEQEEPDQRKKFDLSE